MKPLKQRIKELLISYDVNGGRVHVDKYADKILKEVKDDGKIRIQ